MVCVSKCILVCGCNRLSGYVVGLVCQPQDWHICSYSSVVRIAAQLKQMGPCNGTWSVR